MEDATRRTHQPVGRVGQLRRALLAVAAARHVQPQLPLKLGARRGRQACHDLREGLGFRVEGHAAGRAGVGGPVEQLEAIGGERQHPGGRRLLRLRVHQHAQSEYRSAGSRALEEAPEKG